jgi:hypothetical protein
MKKLVPFLIVVVVIVGGAGAYFLFKKDNKLVSSTETASSKSEGGYKIVEACDAVTQADANALLGAGAVKGDNSFGDTSSDDINVSTCTYTQASNMKSLTLLARSAKTRDGVASNNDQFTTLLPAAAQNVTGFGDKAYWDPTYGQLNILLHKNWYILTIGGLKPTDKTLDEAKTFATRIMPRL